MIAKIFLILNLFCSVKGALDDKFHSYDIVKTKHIHVHSLSKRSIEERRFTKEIKLSAFGKNFTIHAKPSHLFSSTFKLRAVHADGSKEEVFGFNQENFFEGVVENDRNSEASFHMDDNTGVFTGVFATDGEEFVVEPLSHHAEKETMDFHDESTMVAYRRSDIKSDSHPKCGAIHPEVELGDDDDEDEIEVAFNQHSSGESQRAKRAVGEKTCQVAAIADYRFYEHMGRSSIFKTANYIANIMTRVNQIYKSTGFRGGNGYGFEFSEMEIHTAASTGDDIAKYPYNIAKSSWEPIELITELSKTSEFPSACLIRLWTATPFEQSIVGGGYIASSKAGYLGGICSPPRAYSGVLRYFNTAWTSSKNGAGSTVSFIQHALSAAHEFGHNLGSEHDPDTDDCAPSSIFGDGKYLMWTSSVTGEDPNNHKFSSCSINRMNEVLSTKSSCFVVARGEQLCGNGRMDAGEECDGGFLGMVNQDTCCASDCTLRPGAFCSPANSDCCTDSCFTAPSTVVCKGDVEGSCTEEVSCDGISVECPKTVTNKADGTLCTDGGSCQSGSCSGYCEYRGKISCVCDSVENSCKRCCRDNTTTPCTLYSNDALADGRSCVQGYCATGVCIKVTATLVERLWDLIDEISIDFLVESFKTNMVACVTCFSLILYVPICIIIWCVDRRRMKKWETENKVHVRTDRTLAKDEDKRPINRTLNASDLMDDSYRRPNSRNQIQPTFSVA
ncbi:ADAM 17-like protease [Mya arenaria]|uniref:ADAM 17-like protease n=1 Tax=Mya arenaria TaxID=6604 RepID=UPI0022E4C58E|nr:ADAM 17-like protease [Mya arenaria]